MTETELIEQLAEKCGLPDTKIKQVVATFKKVITEKLAAGEKLSLLNFVTFDSKINPISWGHNNHTKERFLIPETRVPVLRASDALRDKVAGPKPKMPKPGKLIIHSKTSSTTKKKI